MKNLISAAVAGKILILAFVLLLVFHILVILKVIPSEMIWGGQVGQDDKNLMGIELMALAIIFLFLWLVVAKLGYWKNWKNSRIVNTGIWVIFIYFVVNTIGNLASVVSEEKMIFTPITIILALLSLRLALEKKM